MIQYVIFIALLSMIYAGYLFVQAKERKRMKRYYGYSTRKRNETRIKKAA
jgi:hypothetical protein